MPLFAQGSTTADWHTHFMLSCTGSMWQIESCTNLAWQCISVCMAGCQIIYLSYACRSLRWLNDSIALLPATTYLSFQGSRRTRMVVMPSPWLGRWHGTRSAMIFAILMWALTASDALSRCFCSNNTLCIERTVRLCAVQININIYRQLRHMRQSVIVRRIHEYSKSATECSLFARLWMQSELHLLCRICLPIRSLQYNEV